MRLIVTAGSKSWSYFEFYQNSAKYYVKTEISSWNDITKINVKPATSSVDCFWSESLSLKFSRVIGFHDNVARRKTDSNKNWDLGLRRTLDFIHCFEVWTCNLSAANFRIDNTSYQIMICHWIWNSHIIETRTSLNHVPKYI